MQVVLGTIGTDLSKDWVQTKLDQRIRSDLLSTVQACLISIRHTKKSYRRMKTRVMTQQELHNNVWKVRHSDEFLRLFSPRLVTLVRRTG